MSMGEGQRFLSGAIIIVTGEINHCAKTSILAAAEYSCLRIDGKEDVSLVHNSKV
jgi:hypothetical protein